jgi:hypothetical protein
MYEIASIFEITFNWCCEVASEFNYLRETPHEEVRFFAVWSCNGSEHYCVYDPGFWTG